MNLEELYGKFNRMIVYLVWRIVQNFPFMVNEKDDLVQDAWVRLLTIINRYDPNRGSMSTFIYTTISQALRNRVRERMSDFSGTVVSDDALRYFESQDRALEAIEVRRFLEQVLNKEDAIIMDMYLGLSNQPMRQTEIYSAIGTSLRKRTHKHESAKRGSAMIHCRVNKAKEKLKKALTGA